LLSVLTADLARLHVASPQWRKKTRPVDQSRVKTAYLKLLLNKLGWIDTKTFYIHMKIPQPRAHDNTSVPWTDGALALLGK